MAGISWEAAMNYCKWRTLQEHKGTGIQFIYRLPKLGEWLAAYNFLEISNRKNDFSKNFSDWTMNTYADGAYGFGDSVFIYDLFLDLLKVKNTPRDKRRMIAGNSYLFQSEVLRYQFATYTFNGYRQVAFRLVKEKIKNSNDRKSLHKNVLEYWGIQMKQVVKINGQQQELFWVYYPDIRKYLGKEMIAENTGPNSKTLDDLFIFRDFSSFIIKTTIDNPYDRYLKDYHDMNDKKMLKEREAFELRIIEDENNTWISLTK